MILWQKRTLVPAANVGQPGPLPQFLVGLSALSLADLPTALNAAAVAALGLANTGYLMVIIDDIPQVITRLQFITALQNAGSYAAVAAAIVAKPVADPVRIYFLETATFTRTDPRLLTFAGQMGQTPAQVDTIFFNAGQVPV